MQLLFCQDKAFDLAFITFTAYTNKDAIVLFFLAFTYPKIFDNMLN